MDDAEALLALIGDIYDAALDPTRWPAVLTKTADLVQGAGATIFAKDVVKKSGNVHYYIGVPEVSKNSYFDYYIKLDPTTTGHYFAEIGEPVSTEDLVDYTEFAESRFYKEWAKPLQFVDTIMTVLDKTNTSVALFGVFRHERHGLADPEARRKMRLLAPHVRRAVLIGQVIDLKTVEAAALADALDTITAGVFLVTADGRVVHANAAGHAMLTTGEVVSTSHGRLLALEAATTATLYRSLLGAAEGDGAIGVQGIAIPLCARSGARYVAHVLPLSAGARARAGVRFRAVAAVFVQPAALREPSRPEVIARHYGLTPTELRVLLAVVASSDVPQAAEALGVAETTVKWHLRNLFAKTGTRSRSELVRLVAGYATPLLR